MERGALLVLTSADVVSCTGMGGVDGHVPSDGTLEGSYMCCFCRSSDARGWG
jgi:hypothetical protein